MEATPPFIADLVSGISPVVLQIFTTVPVVVTVLTVQAIKVIDRDDSLKRYYWLVSLFIGMIVGVLFAKDLTNIQAVLQDAFISTAVAGYLTGVKTIFGKRLPGDKKRM